MYGNGRKNLSWAWKKSFFARKAVEVTENKSLLRGPKGYGACAELWKSPLTRVSGFLFPRLSGWMVGKTPHQNRLVNLIIQHLFIQSESREIPDLSPADR